jgi:hypothetical protein
MVNSKGKVEHNEYNGGFAGLVKRLQGLQKRQIQVGIPQQTSSRKEEGINNAELLYIHTHGTRRKAMRKEMQEGMDRGLKYSEAFSLYIQSHGSPLWHSPPRPVLEPAIKANKGKIALQFSKIIKATADGNADAMERAITSTGMTAQNACRAWFKDPRNRWPLNDPKTVKLKGSDKPLVDSGELRDSIVYVVREE